MKDIAIISAGRTAIGEFGGGLAPLSAVELGTACAKEVIRRANVTGDIVDDVILGNVLNAGCGQNVARQIQLDAGIPCEKTAMTINKVCGSGLQAIALGAQAIMTGDKEVVLAGGVESMSNAGYVMPRARWGMRMGNSEIVDTMVSDGLMDAFNDIHMGVTAENLAEKYELTRQMQDQFSADSQQKTESAQKTGRFVEEIIPITVHHRKKTIEITEDEHPRHGTTIETLARLRPAFKEGGTVTAGNASGINDGAAMVLLMSCEKAESMGLRPMAVIRSWASAGVDPVTMGFGPVPATQKALEKSGLNISDLDLIECNEAFAAQSLSVIKALDLPMDITNVNGGAIALGHPIGASGARILVTLLYEMVRRQSQYGLATLCIGGGMGMSMVIKH
ncbi:Acetyl-CoA acetyltransferase [invertebrate metagenome]|uniref:Acetyl-CoA acetyltransferase n=1 Tax=invertebrate metagenome TaxID=1711999 RepID=A0A2H9T8V1_9ZZZZ